MHRPAAAGAWPSHAHITRAEGHPPPSPRLVPREPRVLVSRTKSQLLRQAWAVGVCGQGSGCRIRRGGGPLLASPQLWAGLARAELPVGPPGPCCLEPGLALVTPGLLCSHSPWEPPNACAGGRGRPGGTGADPGGRSHLLQGPEPSPKEVGELCSGLAGRQHVHGQSPAGAVEGRGDPMLAAPLWAPAFCRGSRLGCGDRLVMRKLREGSTGPLPGGDTALLSLLYGDLASCWLQ